MCARQPSSRQLQAAWWRPLDRSNSRHSPQTQRAAPQPEEQQAAPQPEEQQAAQPEEQQAAQPEEQQAAQQEEEHATPNPEEERRRTWPWKAQWQCQRRHP